MSKIGSASHLYIGFRLIGILNCCPSHHSKSFKLSCSRCYRVLMKGCLFYYFGLVQERFIFFVLGLIPMMHMHRSYRENLILIRTLNHSHHQFRFLGCTFCTQVAIYSPCFYCFWQCLYWRHSSKPVRSTRFHLICKQVHNFKFWVWAHKLSHFVMYYPDCLEATSSWIN